MGVSKGGGRGQVIAPERVAVSGFGRRRSLSDLAVWGFPEFSRKIFPLKPFLTPFHPFFSPSVSSFKSSTSQNPLPNSLDQALSPFLPLFISFFSLRPLFITLSHFLGPYRTPSEHLRNPSLRLPKSPKRPKIALFRPFQGVSS